MGSLYQTLKNKKNATDSFVRGSLPAPRRFRYVKTFAMEEDEKSWDVVIWGLGRVEDAVRLFGQLVSLHLE